MPVQTINGNDFYNFEIKDARILAGDSNRIPGTSGHSLLYRDYSAMARRRKEQGKCKRFGKFLYNKDKKTSCNRTGKHWAALIFYFVCFLGILLVLFLCYFYGINRTMASFADPDKRLPVEGKIYVSDIPTFTFVPLSVNDYTHPMIWYKMHGPESSTNRRSKPYVRNIKHFFKSQATICAKKKMSECTVNPGLYGPCGTDTFGFEEQKPCLLLKMNFRNGWNPDAFHNMAKVPKSMPKELKDKIDLNRETVCIHCGGETAYDSNKIGKIAYYPEACYNDSFFPLSAEPFDVNPTIAIQIQQLQPGYIVELSCRLYGVDADGHGEHHQSVFLYVGTK